MTTPTDSITPGERLQPTERRWPLQEAQSRLGELVRRAQVYGPQHVTVDGHDAAVVIGLEEYARLQKSISGRDIVRALQGSPLSEVNFERQSVRSPVRKTAL